MESNVTPIGTTAPAAVNEFDAIACPDPRYEGPFRILMRAIKQSCQEKGAERHGTDECFEDQPTSFIGRVVGRGFGIGQAMKKLIEAERLEDSGKLEAANAERLGAINYITYGIYQSERKKKAKR